MDRAFEIASTTRSALTLINAVGLDALASLRDLIVLRT
ncbi:MAG: hypothetical protein RIS35_2594 [Pseudomonadota bacterium]|jgi:hypothetical protein